MQLRQLFYIGYIGYARNKNDALDNIIKTYLR